tara:strand:- start:702 stop:1076 length:375 start_codon:yes stop_codon:yes gene_type:complete
MAKKNLTKTDILKANLIKHLTKSLGIVTTACKNADCSRETFYKYCREDEAFNTAVKDIENIALDFVESQLHKSISRGKEASTIFYLKTKGKRRGYIERIQTEDITDREPIQVTIIQPNENRGND